MKSEQDSATNRRVKLNKELITKKDLFYWLLFLNTIIIIMFVWRVGDQDTLINQFSLAGSISSILLALIAIAYAFFQTNDASNENKLMLQTLNKIRDEIEQLEDVNESLRDVRDEFFEFKRSSEDSDNKIIASIDAIRNNINLDFIYNIIEDKYGEIDEKTKSKIKNSYNQEIDIKIKELKNKAVRINSNIQAAIINYLDSNVTLGEIVDEDDLINFVWEETGKKLDTYDSFIELQRLDKIGIISFVKRTDEEDEKLYVMKTSDLRKTNVYETKLLNENYRRENKGSKS